VRERSFETPEAVKLVEHKKIRQWFIMDTQIAAPEDRYCDLVMKGGITSGIVYPKAISTLARHYRFKNIGGTSAGAIAASVTAAAEYRRRCTNSMSGFDLLEKLPEELAATTGKGNDTKLLSLFQPQKETRRLFRVLSIALNKDSLARRVASIAIGLTLAYWPVIACSLALAIFAFFISGKLAAALAFLIFAFCGIGFAVFRDVTGNLVRNKFGLCTGMPSEPDGQESVTTWLHAKIQEAAGRGIDDPPLTFGDLWSCQSVSTGAIKAGNSDDTAINLRVFTTNLTHGRPYILPLTDPTEELYFRPDELKDYLPESVLNWITNPARESSFTPGLYKLPDAGEFPVLLAARLSLSFPILFSAVPLWALYRKNAPKTEVVEVQTPNPMRCWFSDGGISSNFPMHLFDGFIPRWPTFGIQLEDALPDERELVYFPQHYDEGYEETWDFFDGKRPHEKEREKEIAGKGHEKGRSAARQFGGFLTAVVRSMQNWNDNCLSRMPGVRDRVVHVKLRENEGGLNLNMTPQRVRAVSHRGEIAAKKLIARYLPDAGSTKLAAPGWDDHRWVRLNLLIKMLEERLKSIEGAIAPPHSTDLFKIVHAAASLAKPSGREIPLSPTEEQAVKQMLESLGRAGQEIAEFGTGYTFDTRPRPELRVRPPL
jgi:predicted acylesterase/phospholipase RssA